MARNRMISKEFWQDYKIGSLSMPCRLFYIGLWNISDDEGYLENVTKWLKVMIFPYDEIDVAPLVKELQENGRIEIKNGMIFIVKFLDHQRIDRPKKSSNKDVFHGADNSIIDDQSTNDRRTIDDRSRKTFLIETKLNKEETKGGTRASCAHEADFQEPETLPHPAPNSFLNTDESGGINSGETRALFEGRASEVFECFWAYLPKNKRLNKAVCLALFQSNVEWKTEAGLNDFECAIQNYVNIQIAKDGETPESRKKEKEKYFVNPQRFLDNDPETEGMPYWMRYKKEKNHG